MKPNKIKELLAELTAVEQGRIAPGRVYTLALDGKGGYVRRQTNPEAYRRKRAELALSANEITAARSKLKLTQAQFSKLLGVSVDTIQNWEQGRRRPRGAAKVLLRVAAQNPQAILAAV